MVIKENLLESGMNYLLKLNTSSSFTNRVGFNIAAKTLRINYPPYNGQCHVVPKEGIPLLICKSTKFLNFSKLYL